MYYLFSLLIALIQHFSLARDIKTFKEHKSICVLSDIIDITMSRSVVEEMSTNWKWFFTCIYVSMHDQLFADR